MKSLHQLKNLDILVVAETKLDNQIEDSVLSESLNNWTVYSRYDSGDGMKHMGLILLTSRSSEICNIFESITYLPAKRNDQLQIQGLVVKLINGLQFGFIYCRSSPIDRDIQKINKHFGECNFLLGDFNLSHRINTK